MIDQQQAPTQQATLAQRAGAVAGLAMIPALSLMVFTRHKIGYRFLDPIKLVIAAFVMWVIAALSVLVPVGSHTITSPVNPYTGYSQSVTVPNGNPTASLTPLILFAIIMFIAGMVERSRRFKDIKQGVSWHTYSRGVSWLSYIFRSLPDSTVKRFIEPAALAVIGLLLSLLPFHFLGYYIVFAAVCMFIFEAWDYEQSLNRMLDVLDSMVDSEVVSENVDYYSQPNPSQRPLDQTAGIPTGIAPDIEAQIQKRRRKQAIQVATPQPVPQYSYNRPLP